MSETTTQAYGQPRLHQFVLFVMLISLLHSSFVFASPVVLDFDDLAASYNLTGSAYGGLTWEVGNPGLSGISGRWYVPDSLANYPHSAPRNAINLAGSTLIGITFPTTVNMGGAYVAVQGANTVWAQTLRVQGYLDGQSTINTAWFNQISTTPAWFDMSALSNVDRIVFEASASFQNQASYGIDNLTFTYVPEPSAMALAGFAGGLLLRRKRRLA